MKRTLEQLYLLPEWLILAINLALGGFVAVAHGGALLLVLNDFPAPPGYADQVRRMVPYTLPLALLVVLGSVIGLVSSKERRVVLMTQSVVILVGALVMVGWAASLILGGIPATNFAWSPGLLTGSTAYAVYLACRFVVQPRLGRERLVLGPVVAAAVALPIDLGVFLRFAARIARL